MTGKARPDIDHLILAVLVPFIALWWAFWAVIGFAGGNPTPQLVTISTCPTCEPIPYQEGD